MLFALIKITRGDSGYRLVTTAASSLLLVNQRLRHVETIATFG